MATEIEGLKISIGLSEEGKANLKKYRALLKDVLEFFEGLGD